MSKVMMIGAVAEELKKDFPRMSRDKLTFAIRYSGAPEPKAGKIGNRRIFLPADVKALREWFMKHRKYETLGA